MNCPKCETRCKRFGKHRNGLQRYRCMTARCEEAIRTDGPYEYANYDLEIRYFAPPWPFQRRIEAEFTAIIDQSGNIQRWVPR